MIEKLDKFLIDRVFQPVVDFSQRKPRWWTLQMGILTTLLAAISGVIFGWHWSVFLMLLAWPTFTLLVCLTDETCASHGASRVYRLYGFFAFFILGPLGIVFLALYGAVKPSNLLAGVALAAQFAFNYFAACRPPKPPVRRTSAKLSTSGAA